MLPFQRKLFIQRIIIYDLSTPFLWQNIYFDNHSDTLLCRKGHCSKLGHWDSFVEVFAQEELSGRSHNFMKGFEQLKAFVLESQKFTEKYQMLGKEHL